MSTSSDTPDTPNLDELRHQVDTLKALLDDPHPGLVSWKLLLIERSRLLVLKMQETLLGE